MLGASELLAPIPKALRQAERGLDAYSQVEEWAYGTWGQIHIGMALAHIAKHVIASTADRCLLLRTTSGRHPTAGTSDQRSVSPLTSSGVSES